MNSLTAECELSGERFFIPAAEVELLRKLGEHNSWIGEALPPPLCAPQVAV